VRAQGVTGYIHVAGVTVDVRPKFLAQGGRNWRQALWRILVLVDDSPTLGALAPAQATEDLSLPDVLGWVLLDGLSRAALEGLPRGWAERRGWEPVLRGRLDTSALQHWWAHIGLVPCIFDEYTTNAPVNRLFFWACRTLASTVVSQTLAQALTETIPLFADVDPEPPGIVEAEALRLPIQHEYLLPAYQTALLLLRARVLQHTPDESAAHGFLWKSSEVFQRLVGHLLRRICDEKSWDFDAPAVTIGRSDATLRRTGPSLTAFPDFVLRRPGYSAVLLDAKYKLWRADGSPSAADAYQVIAGGRAIAAKQAILVYPRIEGVPAAPLRWELPGVGLTRHLACMSIDVSKMVDDQGEAEVIEDLRRDLVQLLS
jgi:5-methylcytosine-specific restriction endonuclease McrBC regulatory subunit McrC